MVPAPSTRRVSVDDGVRRVDLCLPANVPVPLLIPPIVDLLRDHLQPDQQSQYPPTPTEYLLSKVTGCPLSTRQGLAEQGVRDGDLLLLTRAEPFVPTPAHDDTAAEISTTLAVRSAWTPRVARIMGQASILYCTALTVIALLLNATEVVSVVSTATATVLAITALAGAVMAASRYEHEGASITLSICATAFGAAGGYLAVPGEHLAPKLLLAACATTTVAVIAARLIGTGTEALTALISFSALATAVGVASLLPITPTAAGSLLAAASVGLMATAARIAISVARLPVPPPVGDATTQVPAPQSIAERARRADAVLSGLAGGLSAAAVLGCLLTVGDGPKGLVLTTIVGISLLLRSRTHVSTSQIASFILGGAVALGAALVQAAVSWPAYAPLLGLAGTMFGGAVFTLGNAAPFRIASPVIRRCVDVAEYATLIALVPAACWAGGLFTTARGLYLT